MKKLLTISVLFMSFTMAFRSPQVSAADQLTDRPEVQEFIQQMVDNYGFHKADLTRILNAAKLRPSVIRSVKAPAEQATWYKYRSLFITPNNIEQGAHFWRQHAATLSKAERRYGVPANIIVATLGVETKYGKYKGNYPVIDALATMAFSNSSRALFFKNELKEFLLLSREQHLNPLQVKGSYAGAIGQPQFMPSSYRNYAVSFSGSPKIDLSNNINDIIASIANYYKKHGWAINQPVAKPISGSELVRRGILSSNSVSKQGFKLVRLQDRFADQYWLGYKNFAVIKRYNSSDLYAMAVYQLSNRIAARKREIS